MTTCTLQFIGTATMLLRLGPFTVLTDPNFLHRGQHAYLGYGLTSRRRTDPALDIADVPDLDAIVLSHMHGDHWDRVARRHLDQSIPVVTTPKAARTLHRQGFTQARGISTWTTTSFEKSGESLRITALPGRHAVGFARHLLPPVMGSLVEYGHLRLYITGDTLLVDDLREIPVRLGRPDVAVLHLGGTRLPGGFVVTMDGRAGAELIELIRPGLAIPVHYDDYTVFKSPLADFRREVEIRGIGGVVRYVARGEITDLSPIAGSAG